MLTPLGEIPDRLFRDMSMGEAYDYLRARRRRPSRRAFLQGAAGVAASTLAGPILWKQSASAATSPPTGVHLAFGADPSRDIAVSWSSLGDTHRFRYGPVGGSMTPAEAASTTVRGVDRLYQHVALSGLRPSTTYAYTVESDAGPVDGTFTTASPGRGRFRFVAFGDMGATAAGIEITTRVSQASPDLVFFVGDLCYADRLGGAAEPLYLTSTTIPVQQDQAQWDLWLAQIEPSAKSTPWMFTPGNHEMEVGQGELGYDGFLGRMRLPAPSGRPYYAFRYGSVAFVALDANDVSYEITHNHGYTGGAQTAWLATTLAALRSDPLVDFIVVGFHHCMYCSNTVHGSDDGPRRAWGALFEQHRVDLVVNGHNHSYERTHPVNGTVYVTAGAGGQAAYPTSLHPVSTVTRESGVREPEASDWSAVRYLNDHSLLVVDVQPGSATDRPMLTCQAWAADPDPVGGIRVVDRFSIIRPR